MFVGNWYFNFSYKKGNIVYLPYHRQYYICICDHISSEIREIHPSEQQLYWLHIDPYFLNNYLFSTSMSDIFFEFSNQNYKHIYKCNNDFENKLNDNDTYDDYENDELIKNDENQIFNESNNDKNSKIEIILYKADKYHNKKRKRKIDNIESKIEEYKKTKLNNDVEDLRDKLLLLNIDIPTKSFLLDKYENTKRLSGSEYSKSINWFHTVCNIPYGKYKNFKIDKNDPDQIKEFFKTAKEKLDKQILGLDDVKQEILEFIARKIVNPKSKGHVLALCGPAGVGKSKISKCLADVLDLPFFQINCGGLNDASVLIGHSETYVGAKPGKIVEVLQKSNFMNPIIFLDEIDKLGNKSREINGILTHLLDEEQNDKFQDNYLSNININLSNAFFIISFNDITKVDSIVSDRMKIIYINPPSLDDKVQILQTKMLPELMNVINLKQNIEISKETIEYVIKNKCSNEKGVRNLKKTFEKILYKFNYDLLLQTNNLKYIKIITQETIDHEHDNKINIIYEITRKYIDIVLKNENKENPSFLSMYN